MLTLILSTTIHYCLVSNSICCPWSSKWMTINKTIKSRTGQQSCCSPSPLFIQCCEFLLLLFHCLHRLIHVALQRIQIKACLSQLMERCSLKTAIWTFPAQSTWPSTRCGWPVADFATWPAAWQPVLQTHPSRLELQPLCGLRADWLGTLRPWWSFCSTSWKSDNHESKSGGGESYIILLCALRQWSSCVTDRGQAAAPQGTLLFFLFLIFSPMCWSSHKGHDALVGSYQLSAPQHLRPDSVIWNGFLLHSTHILNVFALAVWQLENLLPGSRGLICHACLSFHCNGAPDEMERSTLAPPCGSG